MIIEEADRVDMIVFHLPIRTDIFEMPPDMVLDATTKAEFVANLFDDYVIEVAGDLELRRVTYPERIDGRNPNAWQEIGLIRRDGWELWRCRFTSLLINQLDARGGAA